MLPRDRRVRTPAEFRHLGRTGTRAGRRTVVVSVATDPDQTRSTSPSAPRPRAGFVVSKAVGNSVVRHRTQRRLRHLASERLAVLPLEGGLLVVRALPAAGGSTSAELAADVDKGLRRLGLLAVGATVDG